MNKSDWYKLLAIGIVAAFVIEGVAIGMLSGNQNAPQDSSQQAGTGGQSLLGTATMNLTILKYEPYLIVKGDPALVEQVKQSLVDRGIATYSVQSGDSVIVNLNSSKSAPAAASEFEKVNATVLAQVTYSMPPTVKVEGGSGISTTVDGATFKLQARPAYEEGSAVPARMSVQVDNGKIIGIGNLNMLPESVAGAIVEAEVTGEPRTEYEVAVPWESRLEGKRIADGEGASYRQKSFIIVPANAAKEQLDAIKLYPYVTGSQIGIVSVKNDFVNASRAGQDFALARLQPEFPPSVATFANDTGGERAHALAEKLSAAGIAATLSTRTSARALLPETIESGGKTYYTGGKIVEFETGGALAGGAKVKLVLDFAASGSTISQITSVKQAE